MIEKLETRVLLAATLANNTLTVTGTPFSDRVDLIVQGNLLLLTMQPENFRAQYNISAIRRVVIDVGAGNDRVEIDKFFTRPVTILGGAGNDTLIGGGGPDHIDGGEGNDWLDGGFDLGLVPDVLIGGPGIDTVDYSRRNMPLRIDLDGDADDGALGERDNVDPTVEIIIGGGAGDVITSNLSTGVTLYGNGGNDTLNSSGGNDRLVGGPGDDYMNARGGDDTLIGGSGNDTMIGGDGIDTVTYYYERRGVIASLGGLATSGAAGERDVIAADVENLFGGQGDDTLTGSDGDNRIGGLGGNDLIFGLGGDDVITGDQGNDTMNGGDGDDRMVGGSGADVFIGGSGTDTADYSNRFNAVNVSADNVANDGGPNEMDNVRDDIEIILGGFGSDILRGGANNITLIGGFGSDSLFGGAGNDYMDGGPGNDFLDGGPGSDMFIGGPGNDTASYETRTVGVEVTLNDVADDGAPGELDNVMSDVETVIGGIGDDILTGNNRVNRLEGRGGNDTLFGRGGNDTLDGGDGDDFLDGEAGGDLMIGGDGIDTVDYSGRTANLTITLDGTTGDGEASESDNVSEDIEIILGGAGDDTITAFTGNYTIFGNAGNDTLIGGSGDDYIDGGEGDDSIIGGLGRDFLFGGLGNDFIDALDLQPDTIDGGDGTDVALADFVDTLINIP